MIDASGTYTTPSVLGANGLPAYGEAQAAPFVDHALPDVLGADRDRYEGKHTLVVGAGHSAATTLLALAELEDTRITWAIRAQNAGRTYGGGGADALPARGALGTRLRAHVDSGRITLAVDFHTHSITEDGGQVTVISRAPTFLMATGYEQVRSVAAAPGDGRRRWRLLRLRAVARAAVRTRPFWLLVIAFTTMSVLLISYLAHLGHAPAFAAGVAGLLGVLSVTGRLVTTGLRRLPAAVIAAAIFALQGVAALLLPFVGASAPGATGCVPGFGFASITAAPAGRAVRHRRLRLPVGPQRRLLRHRQGAGPAGSGRARARASGRLCVDHGSSDPRLRGRRVRAPGLPSRII
ncbi:hypothetical protein [Streptosporangium roseum]|uniref:hypothetical protein n=1 Tax=Streptosporangium roseum TaxID=2001 RepID=UPI00068B52F0|nr:hypothetical protein [Streptosporangium roseum]